LRKLVVIKGNPGGCFLVLTIDFYKFLGPEKWSALLLAVEASEMDRIRHLTQVSRVIKHQSLYFSIQIIPRLTETHD
jgi:hypothetical protein